MRRKKFSLSRSFLKKKLFFFSVRFSIFFLDLILFVCYFPLHAPFFLSFTMHERRIRIHSFNKILFSKTAAVKIKNSVSIRIQSKKAQYISYSTHVQTYYIIPTIIIALCRHLHLHYYYNPHTPCRYHRRSTLQIAAVCGKYSTLEVRKRNK
jgi:hypothetical protein